MPPIIALEFYSGIGGLHLALSLSSVDGRVVQAFDWDQNACQVYNANFPSTIVSKVDIATLTAPTLTLYNADLWLLSPACQPYTVLNPKAKGALDRRAQSFLHLVQNVLPELSSTNQHPSYILVENVAGFENSTTRQITLSALQALGYTTLELLLTPLQFGIPNSRMRYYLLAKKAPLAFAHIQGEPVQVHHAIPGHQSQWVDPRFMNGKTGPQTANILQVKDYLIDHQVEGLHPCAVPEKVLEKWGRLFDIVVPSSRRTCCFTQGYTQLVERTGSVLQMNESLETTEVFDKFLKAQSCQEADAVKILRPLRLRYFSPEELLRLFYIEPPWLVAETATVSKFNWPESVTQKKRYRLIGNSVNVRVVYALIDYLFVNG